MTVEITQRVFPTRSCEVACRHDGCVPRLFFGRRIRHACIATSVATYREAKGQARSSAQHDVEHAEFRTGAGESGWRSAGQCSEEAKFQSSQTNSNIEYKAAKSLVAALTATASDQGATLAALRSARSSAAKVRKSAAKRSKRARRCARYAGASVLAIASPNVVMACSFVERCNPLSSVKWRFNRDARSEAS